MGEIGGIKGCTRRTSGIAYRFGINYKKNREKAAQMDSWEFLMGIWISEIEFSSLPACYLYINIAEFVPTMWPMVKILRNQTCILDAEMSKKKFFLVLSSK